MEASDSDDSRSDNLGNEEIIEEKIYKYNGEEIIKKYVKGKFLGKGGFAKCYEFKCINNKKTYAAKIVCKDNLSKQSAKQKLKSEIKIHKALFNANIVKFEHVFEDSQNVYILLELCKNKTLNEIIKKRKTLTEIEVRYYLDQILKAVKFMHKNKIIHRDLKLGNLFVSEKLEIKIGDFGLATQVQFDGEKKHTICGTPNYIAPEILEGKSTGHSYEVDYWAIGVIIYTLLVGRPPFETDDVKETYKRIQNNIYSFPTHIYISDEAKDLITNILVTNPSHRFNLEQMRNHPFMVNVPLPKSIPSYTVSCPPNSMFLRKYKQECNIIKGLSDLSEDGNNADVNEEYNKMSKFVAKNVKKLNVNIEEIHKNNFSSNPIYEKQNMLKDMKIENQLYSSFEKTKPTNYKIIKDLLDNSHSKEKNEMINIKRKNIDIEKIDSIVSFVDYSEKYGVLYFMNNFIIGIIFKDKTRICKSLGSNEYVYYNKLSKSPQNFNVNNTKDTPSEIKLKYDFLSKYEIYLKNNNENAKNYIKQPNNNTNVRYVTVKKILKTEKAFIFKMSNTNIQLIFNDHTKILIDNCENKSVIYFDKKQKVFVFNIHLVNKCNNKGFLKRYEYYKKVFYDKMEEFLSKKHSNKEN